MASAYEGDAQDLRIVLLGACGAGKSSTASAILGGEAYTESRTRECVILRGRVADRNISIIDTPGFFNTQLTEEEMKNEMMKSLIVSDPGPQAFLLIINLENFEEEERNVVEQIQENFGAQALKFTMILFVGREKMTNRKWKLFMESLRFQELVNCCRGKYHVINNTNYISPTHITKLLEKIDEIIEHNDGQHYKVAAEQQLIPAGDAQDLRIVLLGACGAGKSSTASAILGGEAYTESRTRECVILRGRVADRNISIIDTPGFFNTQLTEEEMKNEMMKSLIVSDPGPQAFLLIINLENFEEEERNVVEQIQENFGAQALKFTMILFVGREKITNRKWKLFMESLRFQELVNCCRGKYHVINNTNYISPTHITKLLEKIDEIIEHNDGQHYKVAAEQQLIPADLRIVMLGKTGAGKSTSGNTILGKKVFEKKFSTESVTKNCQKHQQMVGNRLISVIDTPGLFDTKISEENLKKNIMKCVEMSLPGPHVFLLVIRLDSRLTDEEKKTIKWIQQNFTTEAAHYTIILFTRGDQLKTSIEELLTKNKQINELVSQCKGGYHVFNNTVEENRSQVSELIEKIDRMVTENGGEHYTNEMYKEAQKRQREEDEKQRLEQEEILRREEKFRNMNKFKKAALVGAGVVGSVVGGAAAVAGGVALVAVGAVMAPVVLVSGGAAVAAVKSIELIQEKITSKNEQKGESEIKRNDTEIIKLLQERN